MSGRERLPQRRAGETREINVRSQSYIATVNRFPDGRIAEAFCRSTKPGSAADIAASEAAILLSFALQFGASVEDLRTALPRDHRGRPEGPAGQLLDVLAEDSEA